MTTMIPTSGAPEPLEILASQAERHREAGELSEAEQLYRRILELRPERPQTHNFLGAVLVEQGRIDEARACFDRALAIDPACVMAQLNRADLKKFQPDDPDLAQLEALAVDPRLPEGKRVYVHFALGKALDDVGQYDRAFRQWETGNAVMRRELNYNEAGYRQNFQILASVFDAPLFARFPAAGNPSGVPIFIVGMPRSGTTLIEQILASHPQVQGAGELSTLHRVADTMLGPDGQPVPFPACTAVMTAKKLRMMGRAYLESLPKLVAEKTRITNKMPTNFAYVGLIHLILPAARIIHALRDPVDTCLSCYSKFFATGQKFTYDLAELGRYYRWYSELMAHWRAVLPPGTMLEVAYEDVVDNVERQARRMLDYCGLPWDPACLEFHQTRRPVSTASSAQVRRPVYRSSVARWRRYESHLGPLLAELPGRP
jgi:hypothetical protein